MTCSQIYVHERGRLISNAMNMICVSVFLLRCRMDPAGITGLYISGSQPGGGGGIQWVKGFICEVTERLTKHVIKKT